jgi:hypothetical protein
LAAFASAATMTTYSTAYSQRGFCVDNSQGDNDCQ